MTTTFTVVWLLVGAYLVYNSHKRHMRIEKRLGDGPFTAMKTVSWPMKLALAMFFAVTVPILMVVFPAMRIHDTLQSAVDRLWPSAWQKKPQVGKTVGVMLEAESDSFVNMTVTKVHTDDTSVLLGFEGVALSTHDRVQMVTSADGTVAWKPVLKGEKYYCYFDDYFQENRLVAEVADMEAAAA